MQDFKSPSSSEPAEFRGGEAGADTETGALGGAAPHIAAGTTFESASVEGDIFFAAVEATRMPMIVTDPRLPDNPIVFANPAFQQMTGYSIDEIRGRNCRLMQGADTDRAVVAELRRAVEDRREIAVEILNYRKNGSAFWNALFMCPVYDKKGELVYFFGSQLDVSRRRDAEDALRQAQKMEALGQLTGGIAHDFNNLLQVILGYLDRVRAKGVRSDPDLVERAFEGIMAAATRGATLTQQLLAFARKQRLDGRLVNINALFEGLRPLIERTLGPAIDVDMRFDATLANARVDTTQAELAFLNILINARDAMPDGGRIVVETQNRQIAADDTLFFDELATGTYVMVSISDTGVGMTTEVMKRATEPFFTTKDQGKGTGLGLSMAYGFAKQSGGTLRVYSEVGHGTTVRLFFPALEQAQTEPRGALGPRPLGHKPGTETVLVVEDQPDVGELAQAVLEDFGYRVLRASTGLEAMKIVEGDARIDLLFTDLIMPGGMNGVVLARNARRARPKLKVLLTTGYADVGLEREKVGGSEFDLINKPYRRSELAAKVRQVLDGPTGVG